MVLREYDYMSQSMILTPLQTDKNMDSTPAFPKFLLYDSEREYVEENGWTEYMKIWNTPVKDLRRPLWWTFLKNETLKRSKIEQDDIRMIMCTDPVFTRYGAAFDQHQNALMKDQTETHQAQTGWTPFYGGLDQRLKRLETRGDQFIEMDWTRYDGTIPVEVFSHIKTIRWLLHAECYKTPENKERYDWYCYNLVNKVVLLPTGEVTQIHRGNPSGQISTTVDNNMVNTFLTAFEVAYQYKQIWGKVPTIEDYVMNVDSICYGDDRVLAVRESFVSYDVEQVPAMYKDIFGMWVKPENCKKSKTLEGLSFCGMTFVKKGSTYFGVPNVDKILSTIESPVKKLPDLESLWGKLISLRILLEHADAKARAYIEEQIYRVKEHALAENIQLPEVGPEFYSMIWTGGPK
nr:MAG: RNA-dependent RNA polymerase [Astroviridae sp.]